MPGWVRSIPCAIPELWLHPPTPQVPKETASAWCKEKDIPYFEVSAKNNINVAEAFETLAKQALNTVSILQLRLSPGIRERTGEIREGTGGDSGENRGEFGRAFGREWEGIRERIGGDSGRNRAGAARTDPPV